MSATLDHSSVPKYKSHHGKLRVMLPDIRAGIDAIAIGCLAFYALIGSGNI
jgi:hypothetical protein